MLQSDSLLLNRQHLGGCRLDRLQLERWSFSFPFTTYIRHLGAFSRGKLSPFDCLDQVVFGEIQIFHEPEQSRDCFWGIGPLA